jgi:1-aminocyclopropane-1-carboxylate deaminase/D-cysteine desulfhydrase-like pyridoxal-dependent ACC family enzyme
VTARDPAGLVASAHRQSPQAARVAAVAKLLGLPCRVHVPDAAGELAEELDKAKQLGAELVMHRPGYNSVISKAARDDAAACGWLEVPFGLECAETVQLTARQAAALPRGGYRRVVVPVGSGMTLAGILHGMAAAGNWTPVLGVQCGAPRARMLDKWAPRDWRTRAWLADSGVPYHRYVDAKLGGLVLDPVYEAKCVPFLQPGDLLWAVACR